MSQTTARQSVLQALRNANLDGMPGISVASLAFLTAYPQASIRRTIGELKSEGHSIVRDGRRVRLVA